MLGMERNTYPSVLWVMFLYWIIKDSTISHNLNGYYTAKKKDNTLSLNT